MNTISAQDIQRDPLSFLHRIEAGESFVVLQGEQPLAEVRPIAASPKKPLPYGLCAGQFSAPADFDQPLDESILQEFEGP